MLRFLLPSTGRAFSIRVATVGNQNFLMRHTNNKIDNKIDNHPKALLYFCSANTTTILKASTTTRTITTTTTTTTTTNSASSSSSPSAASPSLASTPSFVRAKATAQGSPAQNLMSISNPAAIASITKAQEAAPIRERIYSWPHSNKLRILSCLTMGQCAFALGFTPYFMENLNVDVSPYLFVGGLISMSAVMLATTLWAQRRYISTIDRGYRESLDISTVFFVSSKLYTLEPDDLALVEVLKRGNSQDLERFSMLKVKFENPPDSGLYKEVVLDMEHLNLEQRKRVLNAIRPPKRKFTLTESSLIAKGKTE